MKSYTYEVLKSFLFVFVMFSVILGFMFLDGCGNSTGPVQFVGIPGPTGLTGRDGLQGSPGSDADSVSVVKLCTGVTTYPSTFVEIAFCVNHRLYGTYSAAGGFSTEIVPGAYSSYGINSSCTFTVAPNCAVSH